MNCARARLGWRCIRGAHPAGPCAAVPRWWNLPGVVRYYFGRTPC